MRFRLEVRYTDYDTKEHVNNAIYLTYFEMARARAWLEQIAGSADFPFVVAEATVRYRSQARIGDPLDISIWTGEVRTKAWTWHYRINDPRDDRLVADGSTAQVMFDYTTRQSIPIPDELRQRLLAMHEPDAASTPPNTPATP